MNERDLEALALSELTACAARATGFDPRGLQARSMKEVLDVERAAGERIEAVLEAARADAPRLVLALQQAVAIGETYFFRNPEQFEAVRRLVAARRPPVAKKPIRAWSAGCATGEEAWSIAAMLRSIEPRKGQYELLATDLVARRLERAREGVYGRWSLRVTQPEWAGEVFTGSGGSERRVAADLRAHVRFEAHHLLEDPVPEGAYDLVYCRNVLVYFSRDSAALVLAKLRASLAPGGLLVLGPMDAVELPPGLASVGAPELQIYEPCNERPVENRTRPPPRPPRTPPRLRLPPAPPLPPQAPARPPPAPEHSARDAHLRALELLEAGRVVDAVGALEQLNRRAPGYVPAKVELALLLGRQGRRREALSVMREVLTSARDVSPDEPTPGPEELPMRFYVEAAEALIERLGGEER